MRVALLTREYPPDVYGGAGVHVEYLSEHLARLVDLDVYCFGEPRPSPLVRAAFEPWEAVGTGRPHDAALKTLSVDLRMAAAVEDADVVHTHTWYANFAGHLAHLLYGIPHVATTHSLEPHRPWKAEQLGGGYAVSSFCERTALEAADAVIAVSAAMRDDVLGTYPAIDPDRVVVIHNGVDTDEFVPDQRTDALPPLGIDPDRPYVTFVGRITRQKGIDLLLAAAERFDPEIQVVLLPSAPDTPEVGEEMRGRAAALAERRPGVRWIEQVLPRPKLVQVLSSSAVAICPSVYEPFGLVNVEAMACGDRRPGAHRPRARRPGRRPRPVRGRPGPGRQRARGRPGHRRAHGLDGPQAGGGGVLLAVGRRPDRRPLPVADHRLTGGTMTRRSRRRCRPRR